MIKKTNTFVLAALILFAQKAICQQLKGVVINGVDGSKMVAASVFVNNSSRGTITDAEGKFTISGLTGNKFELIVSYTGFATASVDINPQNIHEFVTVKIFPRKQDLEEVKVYVPEKDGWKRWGKFFTELFIGVSDFAAECTLENPEVIKFLNKKSSSVLTAYSNAPLIIHNKALGYNIKYQLEDFSYDFKKKIVTYLGYTGFEEMAAKNDRMRKVWLRNRHAAFDGSLLHFMRALFRDSAEEAGFIGRQKIRIYKNDSIFSRIYKPDSMPLYLRDGNKMYRIQKGPVENYKNIPSYLELVDTAAFHFTSAVGDVPDKKQKVFYFEDYLEVIYKNAFLKKDYLLHHFMPQDQKIFQYSTIYFVTNTPVTIEENGLFFNPLNLLSTGYWGWTKMAETLPSDYVDVK